MTAKLKFKRKGPEKGTSLVILVHGYGADGADLLGLSDALGPHLPETVFVAPDAPERCSINPMGFQWFPIPAMDGSSASQARAGIAASISALADFIDARMAEEGIAADHTVLFGFSQGTMLSLALAPMRSDAFAAVVGFSGRILDPKALENDVRSRPPILLVHGDADEVVPPTSLAEAGQALTDAGFEVYAHVMEGTGHGIAPDGLSVALAFLADKLGVSLKA